MKWYGYILRMNEERIRKKVLNMKAKGKLYGDGNNRLRKMLHARKERHGKKLRRSFGKTEENGEALLSDNPHKVEMSYGESYMLLSSYPVIVTMLLSKLISDLLSLIYFIFQ
jgi:hypothetical protein